MRTYIRLEFYKLRGRLLWVLSFLFLLVQGAWMWWAMGSMRHQEIVQGWCYYVYQLSAANAILLPVLMAGMASRIADVEQRGNMLPLLCTLEQRSTVLLTKLCCGSWYLLWLLLGQIVTMLLIGLYKGFYNPIPWDYFGYYLLFTGLTTLCIYLVQLLTAMLISNQAVGLIVGVVGSFCGLFSLFLQQHVLSKLWLWTYYSQLFLCGMNWDKETRVTEMYWVTPDWGAFLLLLVGFLLTLLAGWRLLERKEW